MGYKKGDTVICRNVPGIIVSYDKTLDYYKVREIKTGSIMPFVNSREIKFQSTEEILPNEVFSTILENVIGVEEAAVTLNLSPGTVKNKCAAGEITAKKIGKT
jgi:hypothetical protein